MEKLPGRDLDRWLARVHSVGVPQSLMRRTLDRVAVVLLQALVDLYDRGLLYADLRPGNLRMLGRPDRRIRLLDAGSLVCVDDLSGRFPHVPAYLPPECYEKSVAGEVVFPAADSQAVMAGRTLFEVATGRMPLPGQHVDYGLLPGSDVSRPVARVIEGLCRGDFPHVHGALSYLYTKAKRRVVGGNSPRDADRRSITGPVGSRPISVRTPEAPVTAPDPKPLRPAPRPHVKPTPRALWKPVYAQKPKKRPWWRRLLRRPLSFRDW
jgi:hypothetical protein